MRVPVIWLQAAASLLLAAWLIWLFLLWQPARQVELHSRNLLAHASSRDWPAVQAMMAEDYRDARHRDAASAIDEARELFSHFFTLQIATLESWKISGTGSERVARAPLGIFGSGTAVAHAVMDEVRGAQDPFEFRWRKSGRWPWQWSLTEVRRADLEQRWQR